MSRASRGGLIILAIFFGLIALLCLGGALPNIDGPLFEAAQRRPYGIAFAVFGTSAMICLLITKRLSVRRVVAEAALISAALLYVGLMFNT